MEKNQLLLVKTESKSTYFKENELEYEVMVH